MTEQERLKRLARTREWRARNREAVAAYNRAYYPAWREANKEKLRKYHKEWQQEHPESKGKWARENRAKRNAYVREWGRKNPEKIKAHTASMRAKRRSAPGHFGVKDIRDLYEKQSAKCNACSCDISSGYHVDHIVALSRGGSNWPRNLQLLCATCNLKKGAR